MIRQCLLCLLVILMAHPCLADSKHLSLGIATDVASSVSFAVLTKAYEQLGIEISGKHMPSRRSLAEADMGYSDGEVSRIASIEPQHPNLIRIRIPVDRFSMSAITNSHTETISSLYDIIDLRVGIRTGMRFAELATRDIPDVTTSQNWDILFDMLAEDRIDVVLATPHTWIEQRKRPQLAAIRLHNPPIQEIPLFHYLHKRHADLAPRITQTLRTMSEKGEIEAIRNSILKVSPRSATTN